MNIELLLYILMTLFVFLTGFSCGIAVTELKDKINSNKP
jgi:hypothetical protein